MKVNRTGITRIVFVFKNIVIKIPKPFIWHHFLTGILANMNESNTWKWNSGKYGRGRSYLLCPVIFCSWGGWILVMKKIDRAFNWNDEGKYNITEHVKEFPGDDKITNYGLLNGKIVKFDYGQ